MPTTKGKTINFVVGVIIVAIILGFVAFLLTQEDRLPPGSGNVPQTGDNPTSDWQTFTSSQYGFQLKYPEGWQVETGENEVYPYINVYRTGQDLEFPVTHHSNATHVSVYPQGIPTEGLLDKTEVTDINFKEATLRAFDYRLIDDGVWATLAQLENTPDGWNEAGFVFAGVEVGNMEVFCQHDGELLPAAECSLPSPEGANIVRRGEINNDDRQTEELILASFEFIEQAGDMDDKSDLIILDSPQPSETVSSPLTVTGEARGTWYFEATFPLVLTNWDGLIIAEGYAEAQDDWMTENFVPFQGTLEFESPVNENSPEFMKRGSLILQKANPSGLPEHDDALEITVMFE